MRDWDNVSPRWWPPGYSTSAKAESSPPFTAVGVCSHRSWLIFRVGEPLHGRRVIFPVQFHAQPGLAAPVRLDPGLAVETEPVQGEPCCFRTAWPLTLWPVEIENVRLSGLPLAAPANPLATGAVSVLRITLKCSAAGENFAQTGLDRLRVFLRGAANVALPLYELLCAHALSVAYAEGPSDPSPVVLPASVIEPVGFAPEEALLPWPARSFAGFRLLTEYFALPEKFLFVDFSRIDGKSLLCGGNRIEIFVYLDRALPE